MADDDGAWLEATMHLEPDEIPLITMLLTTHGVHLEPAQILATLSLADQVALVRDVAAQLRDTADRLEERAEAQVGLAQAVEEAMR